MENANDKKNLPTLSQRLSGEEQFTLEQRAFKGRYQTELFNGTDEAGQAEKRLLIPQAYTELLQFGGVITVGTDEHLMLFSAQHWQRMVASLSTQVGTGISQDQLVRHVYGRHVEFEQLNDEGNGVKSISLNSDLVTYARLVDKVVLVGLIYYAEVHAAQHFFDQLLSADQVKQLASALR